MANAFTRGTRRRFSAGMAAAVAVGGVPTVARARDATPTAGGMTVDDTRQVLNRYREAIFGSGDFGQGLSDEELRAFLSDDVVLRYMDSGEAGTGPDWLVANIATLYSDQFDAQATAVNTVVSPGQAAIEGVVEGIHTGEFAGIPPTGIAVRVPYAAFYTMAGGRITEVRVYGLHGGLAAQVSAGATPVG